MSTEPELTDEQKAELLVAGIEAMGLDVDKELGRIHAMPPGYGRASAIQEYQLAAIGLNRLVLGHQREDPEDELAMGRWWCRQSRWSATSPRLRGLPAW
jgi:hypothetical protein